jgi:hypothetical protein
LISQNKITLPNYTNPVLIKNQTIFAGTRGPISCPVFNFYASSTILNSAGFSGIYPDNRDVDNQDTKNYVLKPDHNGTITLLVTGHLISNGVSPSSVEITNRSHIKNESIFLHHDGKVDLDSHNGVYITYVPESEILQNNKTVTVIATISVKQDAPHGDYWIILAPGTCNGGQLLLLTITN